jgi:hypothetical protein
VPMSRADRSLSTQRFVRAERHTARVHGITATPRFFARALLNQRWE